MNLLIATIRTIFFYFYIIILYRIMGKREIGELSVIDLIVSMLIANIVAISIENLDHNILESVIPILLLGLLEIIIAFINIKSKSIRYLFQGKPSLIIKNGRINHQEMIKQRYNLDDLLTNLRLKDITCIDEVSYAILEANGNLSVFKKNTKNTFPLPIIMDGKVDYKALSLINKDIIWLKKKIALQKITLNNIFYAYYQNNRLHYIMKNDLLKTF